ncbi:cell division protein FtsN [Neisseria sp. HSC-16F19]|nr:cell division protein [Neisseria sp. HSC-16F19]MCP2040052.1 cell division protein FtsN [Neisseria sp. HSC-16F19]
MKWLFAILVALNIIVFGSMMAGKMIRQNQTAGVGEAPQQAVVAPPPVIPSTPIVSVASEPAAETPPAPAAAQPAPKTRAEQNAEAQAHARAQAEAKARKEEQNSGGQGNSAADKPQANCTATAVLPEDDYHRIKGLLRWPHSANRFVEQNQRKPSAKASRTRYMVVVGGGSEAREQLKEKGFETSVSNGQVSLGVFNRRSDAESLQARAQGSGFSASIVQLGGGDGTESESQALSVAKMRVTFSNVDDQSAAEINKIIGRYGSLQRAKCKRS